MMYNEFEKGRFSPERDKALDYRTDFRRDVARIIHSQGIRRLARKTQLFPCEESDYFRTRLTHSMEVAQIATSIALKINNNDLQNDPKYAIDLDLVELAGWAHDLGHPPFGHQGEEMLAECMRQHGGFEGNAQTLRLLSKIEKKVHNGDLARGGFDSNHNDQRFGLNLTYRSLASILKYDSNISLELEKNTDKRRKVFKGYYSTEAKLVETIKEKVTGKPNFSGKFKTIECDIMDVADDITYSTYDLEDAFKSGFITPIDMLIQNETFYQLISEHLERSIKVRYTQEDIINVLSDLIKFMFDLPNDLLQGIDKLKKEDLTKEEYLFLGQQYSSRYNQIIVKNAYARTDFSSQLVESSIKGLSFDVNKEIPALSRIKIDKMTSIRIEILKQIAFMTQVHSPRLKALERRGRRIVKEIFEALEPKKNQVPDLLPDDFKLIYQQKMNDNMHRYRTICDYIACMTDRYALEFYGRISSENPSSMFKQVW